MRRSAAALALVATLAACGGDEASITKGELPRLVLQPTDLARVWTQFDGGQQAAADAPGGERSDPARFGRTDGWKARYRRAGGPQTPGPLVIESLVDLFGGSGGANDDLEAARADLLLGPAARELDAPEFGEEAWAVATGSERPGEARYITVAWRHENALATLTVSGFQGRLGVEDALRLARRQQARMARAAA